MAGEFVTALQDAANSCGRLHADPLVSVFFVEDPLDKTVQVCQRFGKKFSDPDFCTKAEWPQVAIEGSLLSVWKGQGQDWYNRFVHAGNSADMCGKGIWLRPQEIVVKHGLEPMAIIKDDANANDVEQGGIGNCWMCSSIAAVVVHCRDLITDGIRWNEEWGVYSMRCFYKGCKVYALLDDLIFCSDEGYIHDVHSKNRSELWVSFMAKVVAKWMTWKEVNGLPGGCMQTVPQFFTGAEETGDFTWGIHGLRPNEKSLDEAIEGARRLLSEGYSCDTEPWNNLEGRYGVVMDHNTAGQDGGGPSTAVGTIRTHGYSVVWYGRVHDFEFVQLRNPWGRGGEFNGAWSDGSAEWKEHPDVVRELKRLGHPYKAADDGVFFMTLDDFVLHFWRLIYVGPASSFGQSCGDIEALKVPPTSRPEREEYYPPTTLPGDSKWADLGYADAGGGDRGQKMYNAIMGVPEDQREAKYHQLKAESWGGNVDEKTKYARGKVLQELVTGAAGDREGPRSSLIELLPVESQHPASFSEWSDGIWVNDGGGGWMAWSVNLPEVCQMAVTITFCAEDLRPMNMEINDEFLGSVCDSTCPTFWDREKSVQTRHGPFAFKQGENKIRLSTEGFSPHLIKVSLEP